MANATSLLKATGDAPDSTAIVTECTTVLTVGQMSLDNSTVSFSGYPGIVDKRTISSAGTSFRDSKLLRTAAMMPYNRSAMRSPSDGGTGKVWTAGKTHLMTRAVVAKHRDGPITKLQVKTGRRTE